MRQRLLVLALGIVGVLLAATVGYAAYLASRDSVGLPVSRLEQPRQNLAPKRARPRAKPKSKPRVTTAVTTVDDHGGATTTSDDHSGRGRGGSSGSGSGSDNSGRGGGDD